jgi:hypothetical protein
LAECTFTVQPNLVFDMKNWLIAVGFLFVWVAPMRAQQGYMNFTHEQYDRYEKKLLDKRGTEGLHTAMKPYLSSRKMLTDSTGPQEKGLWKRLLSSNWVQVDTGIFHMRINPILDMGGGTDTGLGDNIYSFSRGLEINIDLGNKVTVVTGLAVNQFKFAGYYTHEHDVTGFEGGSRALPAFGRSKRLDDGGFDMLYSYGNISYSPSKYFNVQAGHGKNFIGDGYRSLLLSDFSSFNPFLKLSTKVWKLEYTNLFTEFQNLSEPSFSNLPGKGFDKKHGSFHYLSMAIGKRLQVGIFEGIIWQRVSDQGYYRGVDINYLNPVIFFRPVEFSLGSPDNAIIGLNVRYDIPKLGYIYGQFIMDDANFGKISELGGLGYIHNKFGWQLGAKLLDIAGVEGLNWRNELNIVRPYTYSHRVPLQSYTHNSQPLAHPLGANFREFISMASYQKGRWGAFATLMMASYGEDTEDFYYGRGLFRSSQENAPDVITNENKLLQGDLKKLSYAELKLRYTINPVNNIGIELKAIMRKLSPSVNAFDDSNIISISISNVPFNNYQSF